MQSTLPLVLEGARAGDCCPLSFLLNYRQPLVRQTSLPLWLWDPPDCPAASTFPPGVYPVQKKTDACLGVREKRMEAPDLTEVNSPKQHAKCLQQLPTTNFQLLSTQNIFRNGLKNYTHSFLGQSNAGFSSMRELNCNNCK